jgi:polyhydroxyalkanoate synthesis regulator phasin
MKDIIEKSINLGLGIAATTKEKVENLAEELIGKGELARQDKLKVQNEILGKLEKSEEQFKEKTRAIVNETLNNLGCVTQKDISELKRTISDLEKKLSYK